MQNNAIIYLEEKESLVSVGKRLYYLRHTCSITRKTLSEKSGIPERTIKSWERDEKTPRHNNLAPLLKIYEFLGIKTNVNWILGNNIPQISNNEMNLDNVTELVCAKINQIIYDESLFEKAYLETKKTASPVKDEDLKSFMRRIINNYLLISNK